MGPAHTKKVIFQFGDAKTIFHTGEKTLVDAGLSPLLAEHILSFEGFSSIGQEIQFLEEKRIRALFFTDPDYPRRLLPYKTMPALLYYRGQADLNAGRTIAVIGTRHPSDYGTQMTEKLISEMQCEDLVIVSGLAIGMMPPLIRLPCTGKYLPWVCWLMGWRIYTPIAMHPWQD
jgi:DNA processing protein